ncbi:hypothetical protein ABZ412_13140 [Nocardia sp. NPDC005746]|uniref:hypothetical protein n=1 Tax=Nocardia sp. NPDC005746 TaxID=3157062 RepID=UPI00340A4DD3
MIDHADTDSLSMPHRWLDEPMSNTVWLLRQELRADPRIADSTTNLEAEVSALSAARVAQFGIWEIRRSVTPPLRALLLHHPHGAPNLGKPMADHLRE